MVSDIEGPHFLLVFRRHHGLREGYHENVTE
jgi:hypothetical protein